MPLLPSKRPPAPMQARDFDHAITLVDRTLSVTPTPSPSMSTVGPGVEASEPSCGHRRTGACWFQRESPFHLRQTLLRRKFTKSRERYLDPRNHLPAENCGPSHPEEVGLDRARARSQKRAMSSIATTHKRTSNVAIDVLYENQRGGFICGKPFFSARALGNLDPAPWTNILQKPSATNIHTAQPPDPSWEWIGKTWSVYNKDCTDKDGWEYSFAFHGKFAWHKGRWWNSFVRRRAWVRKRIKKKVDPKFNDVNMLNMDYFTVHSGHVHGKSQSSSQGNTNHDDNHGQMDNAHLDEEICHSDTLKNVLRSGRIDREKIDAVKMFIENGNEELIHLQDQMHDIMRLFVFHASREALIAHLRNVLDEKFPEQSREQFATDERRKYTYLAAALKTAEEEIKLVEEQNHESYDTKKA
ncbi:hypothetical protein K3495_g2845 [Podosphaera aphanis]|nr:hypothetical protein K3495_g2845 [Podosphaera aphanis]